LLEIEDISSNSNSGIRPGYFILELWVEDEKCLSKALLAFYIVDPFATNIPQTLTDEYKTAEL
jgi:hypothetical protein